MEFTNNELIKFIQTVVEATITSLNEKGLLGSASEIQKPVVPRNMGLRANADLQRPRTPIEKKSAYAQTESLLFNYMNFKKIIADKEQEIAEIRKYGVLQKGSAVVQYGGNSGGTPQGIVLDEERVEKAVQTVEKSMVTTKQAIALIDSCMTALSKDPYYRILEMRYFEGRTQEDIAIEFNCTQQNIAYHKSRLVKELGIRLFPDKVIEEYLY